MKVRPKSLYYGWVVALVAGGMEFANAASAISILTIFVGPMTQEFGWTRTEIAGATSVGAVLGAGLAPFVGRLVDRHGSRVILVVSGSVIATACIYLSQVQTLLGFYLTASRIADQGGVKIGTSVTVVSLRRLIDPVGRIPVGLARRLDRSRGDVPGGSCALLVRRQPEEWVWPWTGTRRDRPPARYDPDSPALPGRAVVDVERGYQDAPFGTVLVSLFLVLHLVPHLTQGVDAKIAVAAISVMAASGAVGSLLAGAAADRASPRWLMFGLYLVGAVAGIMGRRQLV